MRYGQMAIPRTRSLIRAWPLGAGVEPPAPQESSAEATPDTAAATLTELGRLTPMWLIGGESQPPAQGSTKLLG